MEQCLCRYWYTGDGKLLFGRPTQNASYLRSEGSSLMLACRSFEVYGQLPCGRGGGMCELVWNELNVGGLVWYIDCRKVDSASFIRYFYDYKQSWF